MDEIHLGIICAKSLNLCFKPQIVMGKSSLRDPRDNVLIADAAAISVHPNFTFGIAERPEFDAAIVEMASGGLGEFSERVSTTIQH